MLENPVQRYTVNKCQNWNLNTGLFKLIFSTFNHCTTTDLKYKKYKYFYFKKFPFMSK